MKYVDPNGAIITVTDPNLSLLIREDGRVERLCTHGVGHAIGHLTHWKGWMGVHGCDGCCDDWNTYKEESKMSDIYITIVVEGKDKKAQRDIINQIDAVLAKHSEFDNLGINFKNVRTRERKPKEPNASAHTEAEAATPVSA